MADENDNTLGNSSTSLGVSSSGELDNKKVAELKRYIASAEESLEAAKQALLEIAGEQPAAALSSATPPNLKVAKDGKTIEGFFNGENMVGPEGKIFSVPANYASKSRLVEGDRLKLSIAEDGSFIFKQIAPVERKKLTGELKFEDNSYFVLLEGRRYNLLSAAVTYHKASPGNMVTVVVPTNGDSSWAALENVIHKVTPNMPEQEEQLDLTPPKPGQEDAPDPFFNGIPPAVEPLDASAQAGTSNIIASGIQTDFKDTNNHNLGPNTQEDARDQNETPDLDI